MYAQTLILQNLEPGSWRRYGRIQIETSTVNWYSIRHLSSSQTILSAVQGLAARGTAFRIRASQQSHDSPPIQMMQERIFKVLSIHVLHISDPINSRPEVGSAVPCTLIAPPQHTARSTADRMSLLCVHARQARNVNMKSRLSFLPSPPLCPTLDRVTQRHRLLTPARLERTEPS